MCCPRRCLLVSRAVFVYNCYPACRWVGRSVVLATSFCSAHSKRHNNMYLHLKCQPPLLTRQPPNESLLCNCVTWNVAIFCRGQSCWPGLAILVMHKNKKIIFVTSFVSRLQVGRWVGGWVRYLSALIIASAVCPLIIYGH